MDAEFGRVYRLDQPMGQFFHSAGMKPELSLIRALYWCDDTGTCVGMAYLFPAPYSNTQKSPATPDRGR